MKKDKKKYLVQLEVTESWIKTRESNRVLNKIWKPYAVIGAILVVCLWLVTDVLTLSDSMGNVAVALVLGSIFLLYVHFFWRGYKQAKDYWNELKDKEQLIKL